MPMGQRMDLHTDTITTGRSASYVISRRLNCIIRGSFHNFAQSSTDAVSWSPLDGRVGDVFGISQLLEHSAETTDASTLLQNALLHRITLLEVKNDFPIPLGVSMSCVPSEETTKTGHKYAFTVFANTYNPNPLVLYEADSSNAESHEWRVKYPTFNHQNLDTKDMLPVPAENYCFVAKHHPVVEVLHNNRDMIKRDILEMPLIDNQWYKISRPVFDAACRALKQDILSNVNTCDLNLFSVQIHRLQNREWGNFSESDKMEMMTQVPLHVMTPYASEPESMAKAAREHIEVLMRKPFEIHCRFEVVFEIQK